MPARGRGTSAIPHRLAVVGVGVLDDRRCPLAAEYQCDASDDEQPATENNGCHRLVQDQRTEDDCNDRIHVGVRSHHGQRCVAEREDVGGVPEDRADRTR